MQLRHGPDCLWPFLLFACNVDAESNENADTLKFCPITFWISLTFPPKRKTVVVLQISGVCFDFFTPCLQGHHTTLLQSCSLFLLNAFNSSSHSHWKIHLEYVDGITYLRRGAWLFLWRWRKRRSGVWMLNCAWVKTVEPRSSCSNKGLLKQISPVIWLRRTRLLLE